MKKEDIVLNLVRDGKITKEYVYWPNHVVTPFVYTPYIPPYLYK